MFHEPGKRTNSPSIVDVGALDNNYFCIYLSNGHFVIFNLAKLAVKPAFAALISSKAISKPKTDGERLYWTTGGPSLYFDDIMKMAMR